MRLTTAEWRVDDDVATQPELASTLGAAPPSADEEPDAAAASAAAAACAALAACWAFFMANNWFMVPSVV